MSQRLSAREAVCPGLRAKWDPQWLPAPEAARCLEAGRLVKSRSAGGSTAQATQELKALPGHGCGLRPARTVPSDLLLS